MRTKLFAFRVVLIALLLSALACNAVTNALGGDSRVQDAQATADAFSTEAAETLEDFPTPDLEDFATPEDEEPVDEQPTEDSGDNEEPDTNPGGGPDDVPVMDGANENFFASPEVVTYLADAQYAEVLAFYKAEMEANGWTYDPNLSSEFGEIAALTYTKDGRTATVSILTDVTSGKTLVAVNIVGG